MAGLGLWRFPAYTMFVEGLMFVAGLAMYVGCTRPLDRTGNLALGGLVAFLLGIYWLSLAGGAPPSNLAIAVRFVLDRIHEEQPGPA